MAPSARTVAAAAAALAVWCAATTPAVVDADAYPPTAAYAPAVGAVAPAPAYPPAAAYPPAVPVVAAAPKPAYPPKAAYPPTVPVVAAAPKPAYPPELVHAPAVVQATATPAPVYVPEVGVAPAPVYKPAYIPAVQAVTLTPKPVYTPVYAPMVQAETLAPQPVYTPVYTPMVLAETSAPHPAYTPVYTPMVLAETPVPTPVYTPEVVYSPAPAYTPVYTPMVQEETPAPTPVYAPEVVYSPAPVYTPMYTPMVQAETPAPEPVYDPMYTPMVQAVTPTHTPAAAYTPAPVYTPMVEAEMEQPVYAPEYTPAYAPEAVPAYTPEAQAADYTPAPSPAYTPMVEAEMEQPVYAPEYTPAYTPEAVPAYTPEAQAADYTPSPSPVYTPTALTELPLATADPAALAAAETPGSAPAAPTPTPNPDCLINYGGRPMQFRSCRTLAGDIGMRLLWQTNEANDTLIMLFTAVTPGWEAFSFSGADQLMLGNPNKLAVIGVTTDDGATTAAVYSIAARTPAGVQPATEEQIAGAYINVSAERDGELIKTYFERPLSAVPGIGGPMTNAIWSIGEVAPSLTQLPGHTLAESGIVNLFGVRPTPTPTPVSGAAVGSLGSPPGNATATDIADAATQVADILSNATAACFPADATVTLASGATVRMDALAIGDAVAVGGGRFSDVFAFSHADAAAAAALVELSLAPPADACAAGGASLRLTPGHYLSVNGRLAAASTVAVGDRLLRADGSAAVVARVGARRGVGLYNPQTVDGSILVNGIVTSTYTTAVEPRLAHAALAPLRALYAVGGGWVGGLLTESSRLAGVLPRGPLVL